MLTKLLPEQISKHWDIISYAIANSLPPVIMSKPDVLNNILMSMLADKMQCWASYKRNGEDVKFEGIVVTKIIYEPDSNTRNLLFYTVYSYGAADKSAWEEGFKALVKFCNFNNCEQLIAYTPHDYLAKLAKSLGAEVSYFISFNVNKFVDKINEL